MSRFPDSNRFLRALTQPRPRPLIIAHRGESSRAPENTLAAALLAHKAGADAWELDVHLTRDAVPVVLHDESLLRTTDLARKFQGDPRVLSGGFVADFDLDEVCALDAGSWFVDPSGGFRTAAMFGTLGAMVSTNLEWFASGKVTIPTLREALWLTKQLDWLVNVELKSFPNRDPRALDALFLDIEVTGTANRVLLSSFDHRDVAAARERSPGVGLGVLTSTPLWRPESYVREFVGVDTLHTSAEVLGSESHDYRKRPGADRLRTDMVSALRDRDVPVLVYTVNDASPGGLAVHLAELGVSGLFSDDPRCLMALFQRPTP